MPDGYNLRMSTAARLITADELFRLPEDETQWCELIEGEVVRMAPPGGVHGIVGGLLTGMLSEFVRARRLGSVVLAETGFIVARNPDTVLAPDGAFIRREQLKHCGIPKAYFTEPPALVIEVMSPGDTISEVAIKMRRWMEAGVEAAWVVDPAGRTVTVYRSVDDIRVLTEKDTLSGESVVPGFECPIAELFVDL
jgi:Uma2 family endonuclease